MYSDKGMAELQGIRSCHRNLVPKSENDKSKSTIIFIGEIRTIRTFDPIATSSRMQLESVGFSDPILIKSPILSSTSRSRGIL